MGPIVGFLVGVAVATGASALVVQRMRRQLARRLADVADIELFLARTRGGHLRRLKALAPVAAGVELARQHPLPSTAALGTAIMTGAALLIPVDSDGKEMDAGMEPMQPPSAPVLTEPARQDDVTDSEPDSDPVGEDEPEPEVVMAAAPAEEPAEPAADLPEPEAITPTTTTTVATVAATAATTTMTTAVTVPDLPEIPTPLPDPEPEPQPEPEPEPEPQGCGIGLSAELAGTRVSVCV